MRQPHTPIPIALAAGLAVGMIFIAWAWPALAHTHNGMVFDSYCCNGNSENGDCQEIPASAVTIDSSTGLVHVTLKPGDHPLVKLTTYKYTMKYSETRRSTNGLYYACLYPHPSILRCLYLPPESF